MALSKYSLIFPYLGLGHFGAMLIFHCQWEGHFCRGRVIFHLGIFVEIYLFGQGAKHFWRRVICFSFSGGSPLLGENKAFMAEPSDRPAINDGTPEELKG